MVASHCRSDLRIATVGNRNSLLPQRLILRNCAPEVCRIDLRIATVGNRNSLLPQRLILRNCAPEVCRSDRDGRESEFPRLILRNCAPDLRIATVGNRNSLLPQRLILRNCAPEVCRSDLRIATVGNWNSLLPHVKLTLHFLIQKDATSNGVAYNSGRKNDWIVADSLRTRILACIRNPIYAKIHVSLYLPPAVEMFGTTNLP